MANNKKKDSKKLAVAYGLQDPVRVKVMLGLCIFFMLLTFIIGILSVVFLAKANSNDGFFRSGDKYYAPITSPVTNLEQANGGIFVKQSSYAVGDQVGYMVVNPESGHLTVYLVKVAIADDSGYSLEINNQIVTGIPKGQILGKFQGSLSSDFILALIDDPVLLVLGNVVFAVLTILCGLVYFLISPRGAKKYEKKKDENGENTAGPVVVANDNAALLMSYISSDDNIQPYENEDDTLSAVSHTNYYSSVRLHDGEVYTVVKKYPEAVRDLEEFGASDMDVIKMNMIGNKEFTNLILTPHKEKTLSLQEVIDFVSSLEGVYCIKKRGVLNWTYKYKSKTVLILKQNDDGGDSYKVSIKVYPDAAYKLNIIYKALEDSTFPIGPFWFMFNNLRNLPGNVIQWLITESYRISKWQQLKADILRDTPTLESQGYDLIAMRTAILSGTKVTDEGKFTIITQTADDKNKYETVLETGFGKLDMSEYTKEYTMLVPNTKNLSFSILTKKTTNENLMNSLCNEMLAMCTQEESKEVTRDEAITSSSTVIKRSGTVKKKR